MKSATALLVIGDTRATLLHQYTDCSLTVRDFNIHKPLVLFLTTNSYAIFFGYLLNKTILEALLIPVTLKIKPVKSGYPIIQ